MRTDGRAPCSGNAEDRGRGPPASPARTPCTWGPLDAVLGTCVPPSTSFMCESPGTDTVQGPRGPVGDGRSAAGPALAPPARPRKCARPGLRVVTCDHGRCVFSRNSQLSGTMATRRHSGDSNIFLSGDRSFPRTFRFLIPRLLEGSMPVPSEAASVSVSDLRSVNSLNIFFMCLRSLPGVFNILF